jgi:hypothetical protein
MYRSRRVVWYIQVGKNTLFSHLLSLQRKRTEQNAPSSNRHGHHTRRHRNHNTSARTSSYIVSLHRSGSLSWPCSRPSPRCRGRPSTTTPVTTAGNTNNIPDPIPLHIPLRKSMRAHAITIPPHPRIQSPARRARRRPRCYPPLPETAFLIQSPDICQSVVNSPDRGALRDFPGYAG